MPATKSAALGLIALVAEPALWLARTWSDPAYQSDGLIVAVVTAGLLIASVVSGAAPPDPRDRRRAFIAIALTATIRLIGRVLAVNTVGALALAFYATAINPMGWLGSFSGLLLSSIGVFFFLRRFVEL